MRIACIGEAMVELRVPTGSDGTGIGFAGDTLNTAIYLARALGPSHEVAFVSVVGQDALSDRMAAFIAAEGVSVTHLFRHATRLPGIYAIATDAAGERTFSYWRENSAARCLFDGVQDDLKSAMQRFDVVYFSAITLAIISPVARERLLAWLADFRKDGGLVAFDSNYRPRLWPDGDVARDIIERAWRLCDIALPSVDDEMALFGDPDPQAVLTRFAGYGAKVGALKRGAEGPLPIGGAGPAVQNYASAPQIIDTTAAGDSFAGGFLGTYLTTGDLDRAMAAGHEFARRVIGYPGAIVPRAVWDITE